MINYFKDIFIIYGIKRILSWLSGNIVEFSFSIPETGEFFIRKIFENKGTVLMNSVITDISQFVEPFPLFLTPSAAE